MDSRKDEWQVIETLLPEGWREAAREQKAFQRARYISDPGEVLRLLLFHAVNGGGLRETVAQARASGIAAMSQVGLLKRLRTSGNWLAWLGARLCESLRQRPRVPEGLRPRAIDGTTVQGPASKGTDWRIHYSLDLTTLHCDWYELTDGRTGELLERAPMQSGDVLIADRNYLRTGSAKAVTDAGAFLLLRMKWRHSEMVDKSGKRFRALTRARSLRVGEVGEWPVDLVVPNGEVVSGRVVVTRLPAPVARRAAYRATKDARRKGKRIDPRTIEAAQFIMVFTTIPANRLDGEGVLELYRYRWQVELAFKRLKQLLRIGKLPHKDQRAARGWIQAKLLVALILEALYRNARSFSPWGYSFEALRATTR